MGEGAKRVTTGLDKVRVFLAIPEGLASSTVVQSVESLEGGFKVLVTDADCTARHEIGTSPFIRPRRRAARAARA